MSGSQTSWLISTISSWSISNRNRLLLVAVSTSIVPSNGIDTRGCRLKPSRLFSTATSSHSDGRTEQSGIGRFTRIPVRFDASLTVCQLAGKGPSLGLLKANNALDPGFGGIGRGGVP